MSRPDAAGEIAELRRCVRDLAALTALPVVWSTGNAARIMDSLADALLGMLRLDFVYIQFRSSPGANNIQVGRLMGRPGTAIENQALGGLLETWLAGQRTPDTLPQLPNCRPDLRGFVVSFGLDGANGLVASGSARPGFPSESEQLLLRVAANQAAVILAREGAGAEREHLLLEVEAERRSLSQVFERAPSFMCLLTGPNHVFARTNEHYRQLVGDRKLLGKPLCEAIPEVASQGFIELLDQVFHTGEPYVGRDVPVRLRKDADGREEEVYVDFTYQAMRGADGNVTGVMVQGIDLTVRKRAEAESRAKDARLQLLMDNVKDYAIVMTDASGGVVEWAGGAERITGYTKAEAIGRAVDLIFTEEDLAAGQPMQERRIALEVGKAEDARWHRRRDGGRFFGDGLCSPVFDELGGLQGFGKIFRDATTEWRARQGLAGIARASRAMNAVLSVDAIVGVLTEEARSIIGAHQAITYLTASEDWKQAIYKISQSDKYSSYAGEEASIFDENLFAQVCKTNQSIRLTQDELGHSSQRPSLGECGSGLPMRGCLAVPLVGHGTRNLGLVLLSDKFEGEFTESDEAILQQLAATAAVGIENARLYDSLKEQDLRKDEFLAILAHELRNPLAPVRTGLEVLNRVGGKDQVAVHTREMMGRQIGHMVRLIDDLMDVSRITRGKLALKIQHLRLREVIDTAVEAAKPIIESAKHAFRVELADPELRIEGDLTRLAQVVGNLLNNAAKYTPPGGSIVLSSYRVEDQIVITVRDNGVGIPAEMLPKVFEMFTQAGRSIDRAQGGLGIGLALARKLVEMHGGSLDASSPGLGLGATFTVRLGVAGAAESRLLGSNATPPTLFCNGALRVLVVDDNTDAADSFALILRLAGYEVSIAHDGPQALDITRTFEPHVVFLDIGLPGMSGYDVARQLRARPESAPITIVAVTGWGSEADRARARQAGFDQHFAKPMEITAVYSLLAQVASNNAACKLA